MKMKRIEKCVSCGKEFKNPHKNLKQCEKCLDKVLSKYITSILED